jgi:hypothetical protein
MSLKEKTRMMNQAIITITNEYNQQKECVLYKNYTTWTWVYF